MTLRSIVFSVPLVDKDMEPVREEAERLVGPLAGLYGKSKRLLGFEVIKVWVQTSPEGPRLNLYFEARESIQATLEAGRSSTHPLDIELKRLFESFTGLTWDDVINQWSIQILDWSAGASDAIVDEEESS
jgi:hypothetical protein